MAANFVVTILLGAALNELLGTVNTYQLLVMMPLLTVSLPANAGRFFAEVMRIAAFEVFDTKPYLDRIFRLEPADPFNADFEALGLESIYILHNMGTLLLAFVYYVIVAVFSQLCRRSSHYKINKVGNKLHKELVWGSLITLVTESYSMLTISCMINLRFLSWDAWNTGVMSALSILVTLLLVAYPIYYAWKLTKHFVELDTGYYRRHHYEFYKQLDLRNGKLVLLQPVWFLLRRLIISAMVVFLRTTVIWQIALMTLNVVAQVIIIGRVQPFLTRSEVRYELFSETILMLVMYHMICFTPFVPDLEVRFQLGYLVCGVVGLHFAFTLFSLTRETIRKLRLRYLIH